jgi:hypothetical protein
MVLLGSILQARTLCLCDGSQVGNIYEVLFLLAFLSCYLLCTQQICGSY